jgi:hypothetical protein
MGSAQTKMKGLRDHTKAAIGQVRWAAASLHTLRAVRPETVSRVNQTHAAHAFNRISQALEHDAALALNRLWDRDKRAVGLSRLVGDAKHARDAIVAYWISDAFEAEQAGHRASKGMADEAQRVRAWTHHREREVDRAEGHVDALLTDAASLLARVESGEDKEPHQALRHFRNTVLAHADINGRPGTARQSVGGDIDRLLAVSAAIVEKMETLVNRNSISIDDDASIDQRYAISFWAMLERAPKVQGE